MYRYALVHHKTSMFKRMLQGAFLLSSGSLIPYALQMRLVPFLLYLFDETEFRFLKREYNGYNDAFNSGIWRHIVDDVAVAVGPK